MADHWPAPTGAPIGRDAMFFISGLLCGALAGFAIAMVVVG